MVLKRIQKIGGSLGLILPRDLAAAAELAEGDEVALTLHGRTLVVERAPVARMSDDVFERACEVVLQHNADGFRKLAEYDRKGPRQRAR